MAEKKAPGLDEPLNKEKLKQVMHYVIAQCCAKPVFGATVFYKLLYFSDFNNFEKSHKSITNETYLHSEQGPSPKHFVNAFKELERAKKVGCRRIRIGKYRPWKYINFSNPDISLLSAEEKETIDSTIRKLSDRNATQIRDYSHEDTPFLATRDGEEIDYRLVFYRTNEYAVAAGLTAHARC